MNAILELTKDEYGRASLTGDLVFGEPVKLLAYAWFNREVWWIKSATWAKTYTWNAQYHQLRDGTRQVIVSCGLVLQDCVIPDGFDPDQSCRARIEYLAPSVLYSKGVHGLGLVVVPQEAASSMRNGIWCLKPEFLNASLEPLHEALTHTRAGHARSFPGNA